jgi:tRNA(Ile)-lysidine synthase
MCLLNLLYENGYKIICAHVNHNIRKESASELKFIKNFCKAKNITFECIELKQEKQNESYYRKKRYDFYKSLADKYETKYIATAHHGDDLIETVLMRLTRGSNLKGYAGFPKIYNEDKYVFIKPLIFYTKDEIIKYNEKNFISYVHDSSNDTDLYTRNRYRHKCLPFLKTENPKINEKYLIFSEEIEGASKYIEKVVNEAKTQNYRNEEINLNEFLLLDKYIQKKELESIISNLYGNDISLVSRVHIENIIANLEKNKNFELSMPLGIIAQRDYDKLFIKKKEEAEKYTLQLNLKNKEMSLPNGDSIIVLDNTQNNSNDVIKLNSSEIKLPLIIRTKCDGDQIEVKNMNGHKKVKSIFIDEKIPKSKRDTWPILTDSENTILWIPGLRKSKFDNANGKKYDIILWYKRKEEKN